MNPIPKTTHPNLKNKNKSPNFIPLGMNKSPDFIPLGMNKSPDFIPLGMNKSPDFIPLGMNKSPDFIPLGMNMKSTSMPIPKSSTSESPDFIPLGVRSPVARDRPQSWKRGKYSDTSSSSSFSYSQRFSGNWRDGFRGNRESISYNQRFSGNWRDRFRGNRGRGSYNSGSSGSKSPPIHLYYDKSFLEDPWAELEEKLKKQETSGAGKSIKDSAQKVTLKSSNTGVLVNDEL